MVRSITVLGLALILGCDKPGAGAGAPTPSATATSAPAAASGTPSPVAAPGPPDAAPDTIIAQHILVIYATAKRAPKGITRTKPEARSRAGEALLKVQGGASFEDVVKEYSDDAASVGRLGSVGKFHRGDMDPAFSTAAFALSVGQVSGLVETPFGFHVIKRTQ